MVSIFNLFSKHTFLFLLIFGIVYFYSDKIKKFITKNKNNYDVIFIPIILLVLLYENIDYRIAFLVLIFSLACNLKVKVFEFIYFFLIFSSATNYLLFNSVIDFLNIFSQYLLFAVFSVIFYINLKKLPFQN